MGAVASLWARAVTGRTVAILFALAVSGLLARAFILAPMFRAAVGFIPFDLQPHLNREMLIIQLGAIVFARLAAAYIWFALTDTVIVLVVAAFFAGLWQWLFFKTPNWLFGFVRGGGIILLPVAAAVLELAEHLAVFHLMAGFTGDGSAAAIELTTVLHNVKIAVLELRNGLTVVFLAVAAGLWILHRRQKEPRS